jgi:hypothetical protein
MSRKTTVILGKETSKRTQLNFYKVTADSMMNCNCKIRKINRSYKENIVN